MGVDHKFLTGKAAAAYRASNMQAFYAERAADERKRQARVKRARRLARRAECKQAASSCR